MSKIKRFLKIHYKKFITSLVVTFLMLSLLISQAFALSYNINVLKYYLNSNTSAYWQTYHGSDIDTSDYKTTLKNAPRDSSNNRFTCSLDAYGVEDGKDYDNLFRCDLTIRVNDFGIQYKKGDLLTFDIYMSTKFEMYDRITTYPYLEPSRYYLKFFRVWFEDDSTLVFFPQQNINTAFQVNDNHFVFTSEPLSSNRPRVVSLQFSFNLVEPAFNQVNPVGGGYYPLYMNVWFNDYFDLNVFRDTANGPIYTPPNNNSIDNHNKIEQGIQEDISGGLEDTNIIFDNFNNMSDKSRLTRGMLFITQLMSRVFAFEAYDILGEFALAIGLVGFLLGLATLIKNRSNKDDNSHTKDNSDSYKEYSRRRK